MNPATATTEHPVSTPTAAQPVLLLIDDDSLYARTLARGLERRGYAVQVANDAASARSAVASRTFDGVLLDLKLGTDAGLPLLDELLRCRPELHIVLLTGYASLATAVDAIKRGAADYLAKPSSLTAIVRALNPDADPAAAEPVVAETLVPLDRLKWEHIQRALRDSDNNVSAAARLLGLHRRSLQRMLGKKAVPGRD